MSHEHVINKGDRVEAEYVLAGSDSLSRDFDATTLAEMRAPNVFLQQA